MHIPPKNNRIFYLFGQAHKKWGRLPPLHNVTTLCKGVQLNFIVATVHVMLWLPVMPLGYLTLMQHTRLQDLAAVLISCYVNILLYSLRETPPTNNCCTLVRFGVNIAEVFDHWQVSGTHLLYLHCGICRSCWVVCMCICSDYQTLRGLWYSNQ